jgi:hypothetical protein
VSIDDRRTQLEYGTKLVTPWAGWRVGLYPDAAEAVAVFCGRGARGVGVGLRDCPQLTEAEREARWSAARAASGQVAVRRARTRVRRYCAANRLNRLGTLTYGPPFCRDPQLLRDHVGKFFRRLRVKLVVDRLPYLWVGEWHQDRQRLHAHFGVGRFVARSRIESAWPHGFVHIKLLGDLPYESTSLEQARLAAWYLSKYVAKSLQDHGSGLHRYEVAQGYAPRCEGWLGSSSKEVLGWAASRMGRRPNVVQPSTGWVGYQGPPAVFASWT